MSGVSEQEIDRISGLARRSAIEAFGATPNENIMLETVERYLVGKEVFANAAPGQVQPTRAQVLARRDKIYTDLKSTLEKYKEKSQGMLLGDKSKGNPPEGSSIQDVVDKYIARLIKEDAQTEEERKDPKNIKEGTEFLTNAVYNASVNTNRAIGNEIYTISLGIVDKNSRKSERDKAAGDLAAALRQNDEEADRRIADASEAARLAGIAQAEERAGRAQRIGKKIDEKFLPQSAKGNKQPGEPIDRRELLKGLGLGTLAAGAGLGAVALSQNGCPTPSTIAPKPVIAPKKELPEGFKIIKKLSGGNPPVEENAVLASESKVEKNAILFVGKNTNEINNVQGVFKDNGTTEIHITNPREHPSEITIDTPKYARTDSNAKDKDPKEKNRTKVDLCLHPSVLANYTLFANSIPNGLGEHSKDVVLSFIPKREVDAEAMKPFKIVIKGHGIDKGGVHKDRIFDQSGIDRIKIIDNTGQNLGELNLVNLPTADVFTGALNALQLEVGKSNYDSEPLKIGNPIMLERFANKRRLDLSQSHGQGGTLLLPVRSGGVGRRG